MASQEIIVCTTLRDFNGTENDLIQLEFLNSLRLQENVKVHLVITIFNEKRVSEVVKKIFDDVIIYNGIPGDYRYSLTQVMNNAINFKLKYTSNDMPILWTTCDVIFKGDFISKCFPFLGGKTIVTSHPHRIVNFDDQSRSIGKSTLESGFDVLIFSSSFISDPKFSIAHNKYVFCDWGVYEHFLISLHELVEGACLFNVYQNSIISKVENNRILTKEPSMFLVESHKMNSKTFEKYLLEYCLTSRYFRLTYCHLKFKPTSNKLGHYLSFLPDLFEFYVTRNIKSIFSKIMPIGLRNYLQF